MSSTGGGGSNCSGVISTLVADGVYNFFMPGDEVIRPLAADAVNTVQATSTVNCSATTTSTTSTTTTVTVPPVGNIEVAGAVTVSKRYDIDGGFCTSVSSTSGGNAAFTFSCTAVGMLTWT